MSVFVEIRVRDEMKTGILFDDDDGGGKCCYNEKGKVCVCVSVYVTGVDKNVAAMNAERRMTSESLMILIKSHRCGKYSERELNRTIEDISHRSSCIVNGHVHNNFPI